MIKALTTYATPSLSKDICVGRKEVRRPKKRWTNDHKEGRIQKLVYTLFLLMMMIVVIFSAYAYSDKGKQ